MQMRRVHGERTGLTFFLVTEIVSPKVIDQLQHMDGCKKYKDGFLFPGTPEFQRTLSEIAARDNIVAVNNERAKKEAEQARKEAERQALLNSRATDYAFVDAMKRLIFSRQPVEGYNGRCSELMNHQKAASMIADRFNKYAFFFDTGTGKTLLALDIIDKKAQQENAHFLVICPKTIINPAWMEDCRHFFPGMKLLPLTKSLTVDNYKKIHFCWAKANGTNISVPSGFFVGLAKERLQFARNYLINEAQHFIVNPELFVRNPDQYLHIEGEKKTIHIDGLIVDESAIMKNQGSEITHAITRVSKDMKYLYLLSGKPAPNVITEYYPQINAVAPELFSYSYRHAQDMVRNTHNMVWGMKSNSIPDKFEDEFLKAVAMASITVSKKDCFDLPPTTIVIRKFSWNQVLWHSIKA